MLLQEDRREMCPQGVCLSASLSGVIEPVAAVSGEKERSHQLFISPRFMWSPLFNGAFILCRNKIYTLVRVLCPVMPPSFVRLIISNDADEISIQPWLEQFPLPRQRMCLTDTGVLSGMFGHSFLSP